jgi:signal transduction histidine kinase
MQLSKFPKEVNRLFLKISLTLLGLFLILGVSYVLITGYFATNYVQEANQRLYGDLADTTVQLVKPLVNGKVDTTDIQDLMHSMMVINPNLEVYLLDPKGHIITYVAPYKRVKLEKVDLEPIKKFIEQKEDLASTIKGDDPRHPGEEKVFSAAPIMEEDQLTGYMYIILASEEQASVTGALFGSYMFKIGTGVFLACLLATLGIGLLANWYFTNNLGKITTTVRNFQEGDLKARIPKASANDFPELSTTFNEMADTIVANIDQLKSVEHLRRELIANVSHDLRTPLAILQGYAETLQIKQETLSTEDQDRYLNIILESSEKLAHLIAQLFEYSKLEAHQIEPEKEPFFIAELAQDVFQKYLILAKEKNIELKLDIPSGLPMVFADIGLVDRVVQNLMDNALKFTPQGGSVTIELRDKGKQVEVKIADTGPGIPEAEQSFIFERYRKMENNTQPTEGAGLGLAIVKKILELHESSIRVQSRLNEGTTFLFQLPVSA